MSYGWLVSQKKAGNVRQEHKFGHNDSIGTTFEPLTVEGHYRSPQVAGATPLRVKAGNVADDAAGTGAREITVVYLDTSLAIQTETLATAGTSASDYTSGNVFRLLRAYVSASGTYASVTSGFSHAASIIIEDSSANVWCDIHFDDLGNAQSQIGIWTVPQTNEDGRTIKEAYLTKYDLTASSNKQVDFILFQRQNVLETAAPYTAARVTREHTTVSGGYESDMNLPLGPFPPGTDIGWMVRSSAAAAATCDNEFLMILGD